MADEIYRYWVELRALRDGSTRSLPLTVFKRVHLPTRKGEPQQADEEVLRLEDGPAVLEAKTLEHLADQLRRKYPDQDFERTLKCERDTAAEERRSEAMKELIAILAGAALERLIREGADSELPT